MRLLPTHPTAQAAIWALAEFANNVTGNRPSVNQFAVRIIVFVGQTNLGIRWTLKSYQVIEKAKASKSFPKCKSKYII